MQQISHATSTVPLARSYIRACGISYADHDRIKAQADEYEIHVKTDGEGDKSYPLQWDQQLVVKDGNLFGYKCCALYWNTYYGSSDDKKACMML